MNIQILSTVPSECSWLVGVVNSLCWGVKKSKMGLVLSVSGESGFAFAGCRVFLSCFTMVSGEERIVFTNTYIDR